MSEPILRVDGLTKHYPVRRGNLVKRTVGTVRAVDGVSFDLAAGQTLGIVGESGCGKSTLARLLVGLEEPTAGRIRFGGTDVAELSGDQRHRLQRRRQMIFQDPYSSLNPRMTVGQIVAEPFEIHRESTPANPQARVQELLDMVGLNPDHVGRYPHQFSGGQRQRVGIARALALAPEVLVCDESVSALDVSIQAQVVNLLRRLQRQLNLAYVFIAHDLSVVRHLSHRVAVMYLGKIVEMGPTAELFAGAQHPYTRALLSAAPVPDPHVRRQRIVLAGDPPSPLARPSGCVFRSRCWRATPECAQAQPELTVTGDRRVACIHPIGGN